MPAKSLSEVFQNFRSEPIKLTEFDEFYVNADEGRGKPVQNRLQRYLERDAGGSLKFLFVGHKGCGKSTELNRLQKNLMDDFVILNFSVVKLIFRALEKEFAE